MIRKRVVILGILMVVFLGSLSAQELKLSTGDLYITQSLKGGYDLFIRKRGDINSVLLVESTADPTKQADSFSLRTTEYDPVNGDERRMLNGEFLDPEKGIFSIIDSSPEPNERFGEAFHLFVPYIVIYGYPWSRSGEIMVLDGTWLNVRTFGSLYADYDGGFADNPFELKVVQKPLELPFDDSYMADTVEVYRDIAEEGSGEAILSGGEDDLLQNIRDLIGRSDGNTLDLVLALDTTESMTDDMRFLRRDLVPLLQEVTADFDHINFGIVYYKDYMENFLTKIVPFQTGLSKVQTSLNSIRPFGGRDIPEAVFEALYASVHEFPWQSEVRMVILIGDAPPHPRPRGEITAEMVYRDAAALNVELNTIILPQ
ncbi:MAG: VWA domain-containing protein [Spirochaetales bacterium]|nr:VWA domain-containing protein [Spirochaetales bacterium]